MALPISPRSPAGVGATKSLPQVVDVFNRAGLESYLVDKTDGLRGGEN